MGQVKMTGRLIELFWVARAFLDLCNLNWTVQLTHRGHSGRGGSRPFRPHAIGPWERIRQDAKPRLVVTLQAYRKRKGLGAGRHLRDKRLGGLLYIRLSRFPNP